MSPNTMSRALRAEGRGRAVAMAVILAAASLTPAAAQSVDCNVFARAAAEARDRAKEQISAQAAATKEAVDAAKDCLANVDRALNGVIPGVGFNVDLSGMIRGMINRSCQVVTSRIDGAGRVISGSASDATNRVYSQLPSGVPTGAVGIGTGSVATPGINPSGGGIGGALGGAAPAPAGAPAASCSFFSQMMGRC